MNERLKQLAEQAGFTDTESIQQKLELFATLLTSESTPEVSLPPHLKNGNINNVLILVDVWEHVKGELGNAVKQNICSFLMTIKDKPNWFVYHNHSSNDVDPVVLDCILKCNSCEIDDPLKVYNVVTPVNYYYGGFHANVCMFDNPIGINKLFQIATSELYNFNIVQELTCMIDLTQRIVNKDGSITNNVPVSNIQYQSGNFSHSQHESLIINENIRRHLIKSTLVSIDNIQL